MKHLLKISVVATAISFASISAHANNSAQITEDALRCSSIFHVMTYVGEQIPEAGNLYMNLAMMMGSIYSVKTNELTGNGLSKGDVFDARDTKSKELGELYKQDPNKILDEYAKCDNWRAAIVEHLEITGANSNKATDKQVDEAFNTLPAATNDYSIKSDELRESTKSFVDYSFEKFNSSEHLTRDDVTKMLEDLIAQKEANETQ